MHSTLKSSRRKALLKKIAKELTTVCLMGAVCKYASTGWLRPGSLGPARYPSRLPRLETSIPSP